MKDDWLVELVFILRLLIVALIIAALIWAADPTGAWPPEPDPAPDLKPVAYLSVTLLDPQPPSCDGFWTWWWDKSRWLCLPNVTPVPWETPATGD